MGKIFFLIILISFQCSCRPTYYTTPTGMKIKQRKFNRITKRIVRNAVRSISKEDLNSLKGLKMDVVYDTIKK